MTPSDFVALLPMILVSLGAVAVMLAAAFYRRHAPAAAICIITLIAALISLPFAAGQAPRQVTPLVIVDNYAVFFMGLIVTAGLAVALLAYDYLKRRSKRPEEFYVLLLLAILGGWCWWPATTWPRSSLGWRCSASRCTP